MSKHDKELDSSFAEWWEQNGQQLVAQFFRSKALTHKQIIELVAREAWLDSYEHFSRSVQNIHRQS